ncbi:MAG: FHA domain-containing protein [Anaerolineales bacterium]|nr:FHA domain-containing protein [Anaerolineales bacterium]
MHIVSEKISRNHAHLILDGSRLELIDLGSTNGTFLNSELLEKNQTAVLEAGDEIRFGDQTFFIKSI